MSKPWVRGEPPVAAVSLSLLTGTFITEWQEGGRLCESFLAGDARSYQAVADRLVQMAQFFRFDGWLINIENSLSVSTAAACWRLPPVYTPCFANPFCLRPLL